MSEKPDSIWGIKLNRRTVLKWAKRGSLAGVAVGFAGVATVADLIGAAAYDYNRNRLFEKRAAERNAVWSRALQVTNNVHIKRDAKVAAGSTTDSQGAVWLDVINADGGLTGRVFAWPFRDWSGFRLEYRPSGGNITTVQVLRSQGILAIDARGSSPSGANSYLIRRLEFGDNGLLRMFDGVQTPNGQIIEAEAKDVSKAGQYAIGIIDYAQTLLDKAT